MTLLTEGEAGRKVCPVTLAPTAIAGEANFYPATCHASGCMAWRWASQGWVLHPQPAGGPIMKMMDGAEPRGFCGMAGKPGG